MRYLVTKGCPMRRMVFLSTIGFLALGCAEPSSNPTSPSTPSLAKGGQGPTVNSADPASSAQDTTLDVRVLGSGFDNGSRADWAIDGVTSPANVRTNSTRYVSGTELVANITVSATAPLVLYDIIVTTLLGKKGIGAEKFEVVPRGNQQPTQFPSIMTIEDAGTDLVSDGKGAYQNNICGVWSVANLWSTGTWGFQLTPAGVSIPKSEKAACTGIAPRTATMRLAVKHLSNSPHLDDPASSAGGIYSVGNLALTYSGGSLFNGPTPCYYVSRNGSLSGKGLRLDSQNYPGSDDLIREDLGNGLWHLYTAPYPNNLAYCEGTAGISYWHVVVNVQVQILSP